MQRRPRSLRMPKPFVIGFAGYSGSGKTTLLRQLIARLNARGVRIGVVKHTHHEFDIDYPGKDSYELRHAGARSIAIGSSRRWALVTERPTPCEPTLGEMLALLADQEIDLVLVEGFRHEHFTKIEIHRPSLGRALLALEDDSIIAIATDHPMVLVPRLPHFDLNDVGAIELFILERAHLA
jgi:molybdopterin-guanine dinucleotide biosynthesis adapter protein